MTDLPCTSGKTNLQRPPKTRVVVPRVMRSVILTGDILYKGTFEPTVVSEAPQSRISVHCDDGACDMYAQA